jgi:hypothetical protein
MTTVDLLPSRNAFVSRWPLLAQKMKRFPVCQ